MCWEEYQGYFRIFIQIIYKTVTKLFKQMRSSEVVKQDIIEHLTWDDRIDVNNVYVYVEDGNVQLKGNVPTYSAKLAASNDAYMIDGVMNVDNQLEAVYPETDKVLNDDEITSNIVNMLLWNSNIVSFRGSLPIHA
jgi:hypothetical protein